MSFYNQTGDVAIHPTPLVGVLGVLDDVRTTTPGGWRGNGDEVYLLGVTREELDGSQWALAAHAHLGGRPPAVDFEAERALGRLLVRCVGLLTSAHDLSDGGLGAALAESALRHGVGGRIDLTGMCERDGVDAFVALFSESSARALVTVAAGDGHRLDALAEELGVPCVRLGSVDTGLGALDVAGRFTLDLTALAAVHRRTIRAVMTAP